MQNAAGKFALDSTRFLQKEDRLYEEMGVLLFDANNDKDLDLYIVSGSYEIPPNELRLPAQNFASFQNAAEEAAISRHFGGIRYMPSFTNGLLEGKKIGVFVMSKLKTTNGAQAVAKQSK